MHKKKVSDIRKGEHVLLDAGLEFVVKKKVEHTTEDKVYARTLEWIELVLDDPASDDTTSKDEWEKYCSDKDATGSFSIMKGLDAELNVLDEGEAPELGRWQS